MARQRSSSSGVIDLPGDDTDPANKKRAGKLEFPSFVALGEAMNGEFNSKVPTVEHAHNNISGKDRKGWNNLYNWADEYPNYRNDEDGTNLKTT